VAKLYFKFGTMGSSKTAQALMTKFNYEQKGLKVLLMKPSLAIRDESIVKSRIGLESKCFIIKPEYNLFDFDNENDNYGNYDAIIVDEAQFLTTEQVNALRFVVDNYNVPVFCYGLRTDFTTALFEGSKRLFEVADSVEDIKNICACGNKAIFNARVDKNGAIQTEGESVDTEVYNYEPLCSKCYFKLINQCDAHKEVKDEL